MEKTSTSGWLGGAILAVSLTAAAQEAELIDQVSVTPLPGPASCFAGTAGTDHVMFIRDDLQRIDCSIFSGQAPCLARREFPADGPNGRAVSLEGIIVTRPSVTGDGASVYFTKFGFNVCGMNTADIAAEGCFGRDLLQFDPNTIAVSPFGNPLAISTLDDNFNPANQILVGDAFTLQLLENHVVATAEPGGNLLRVDAMDFTVDGQYILTDAYNPLSNTWAIYAVERATGVTRTVVAPVAGLHLRNPALAQTTDDLMTFDAQSVATGANAVLAANLLTGQLSRVADTDFLAYRGYTGSDAAIVFTDSDPATESRASLDLQVLLADGITPDPARGRTRYLTDGGVGVIYRRGAFDGTLRDPETCGAVSGLADSDGDGLTDEYERQNGLDPMNAADALGDSDSDGFSNLAEAQAGTDPQDAGSVPSAGGVVSLAASVLPASRSVQQGNLATAFATIINAGGETAAGCSIAPRGPLAASFFYRTTDALTNAVTGEPNAPVDIAAGASQSFLFGITPNAVMSPIDLVLTFDCVNTDPAASIGGVNTLLLSSASGAVADVIALAATATGDGIVNVAQTTNAGAFSVATVNVGAGGAITAGADTGSATLPVELVICGTDPVTGACITDLGPTVDVAIGSQETPTFSVFATASQAIPFDPAANRVFVRFTDSSGVTRGSTSVAIRTEP